MADCEFLERSRRSGEVIEVCGMNGRVCLCLIDYHNCTRRTWALEHPQVLRSKEPKGEVTKSPE